jgi:hypothetical protein
MKWEDSGPILHTVLSHENESRHHDQFHIFILSNLVS